ncbi:alpha/beta hydrolase [soil metagenome]
MSIDADQRAAEVRLYAHYGLTSTERYIQAAGTTIRVVEVAGDPALTPVLLLHGAASVTAAAIPLIPAFNGARVIALDWPGHGLSGPLRLGGSTDLRALAIEIVDAVADAFALDKFDVVAHSLGGQLALYYALAKPDRVRRLVLLGAPGAAFGGLKAAGGFGPLAIPFVGALILRIPVSREQYGKNSALTLGEGTVDQWPRELVDVGWFASRRSAFKRTIPGLFRAIVGRGVVRPGIGVSVEELAAVGIPTLFVWGTHDVFASPADAREWIDAVPGAKLVELDAGHAPWLNKPEEAAAAVSAFLAG